MDKKNIFTYLLSFLLVISIVGISQFSPFTQSIKDNHLNANGKAVLGDRAPEIHIFRDGQYSGGGGMIALTSAEEPSVNISGYDISGKVEVAVYEADEQALLDYLTHDEKGNQIKKTPEVEKFRLIKKLTHEISTEESKLLLPLETTGIYLIRIMQGSVSEDSFILRSDIGGVVKEGDNEYIFWAQNFKNKRSITKGKLSVYNLKDSVKEIGTATFNDEGIAKTNLYPDADIALLRVGGEKAVIPINLLYLNSNYNNYKRFSAKERTTAYFTFTDRPIYKPGDIIYFKSVLRDDDDARYTIPKGQAVVKIFEGWDEDSLIFEQAYEITQDGTVSGEYTLPADAKTDYYHLEISIQGSTMSETYFNVEHFRKPEYSIDVTVPKSAYMSGDKTSFTISGKYFSGQPLATQIVKYTIYSDDFYQYDYLVDRATELSDDYRYGYWGGSILSRGEVTLNREGVAEVELDTKLPQDKGKNQVFSIEATVDDSSGNPSFSRKNVLVYAGEYDIYRKDTSYYSTKVNTQLSLPVTLVSHYKTKVSEVNLTAKVHRENWIEYTDPNEKYPQYRKEEEDLPEITAKTDSQGNATFAFTPTKVGSYKFTVRGYDSKGNTIVKEFYSYVSSETYENFFSGGNNNLTIRTDKEIYLPTDKAHLTVTSTIPDRDILLSLERGRTNRFQVIKMKGKVATVDIPLVTTDMPNMYANVSSFSDENFETASANIVVSAQSKKLTVNVKPNRDTFGPGDNATINLETKDQEGNPVSAEVALWAVDKAIFELADGNLGNIFETYWSKRYDDTQEAHSLEGIVVYGAEGGGGCFAAGTSILMADGSQKAIENVKSGDYIVTRESEKNSKLVKAKVLSTHEQVASGYLIVNGKLRVTTNHKLWVNNSWKEAGMVQIGDTFIDIQGKPVIVNSVEWLQGKSSVYNLSIEKYRTFFADGLWVHNQKGGGPRTVFKDTAYWNPSVKTDGTGKAKVTFKLPDNMTTWVVAAVGATIDTKVGQTTEEIMVTKDVIVRPILPNILRQGDQIKLSALVQNFTEQDQTFDVDLSFDAGTIDSATHTGVRIRSKEMQHVYWNVSPKKITEKATLTISAKSRNDKNAQDTVVQVIPVREFGFSQQRAETGDGAKTFSINLAEDSHKEKSTVTLSLAPTILGTLPTAMGYLVNYPYGCVEQTTSRLIPAIIAKANPEVFASALEGKDVDDMIAKGMKRLADLQQNDGGWSWWQSGKSDPFVTAYVIEYLLQAKQQGIKVDEDMLIQAQWYFENDEFDDTGTQIHNPSNKADVTARNYALTLLGAKDKLSKFSYLEYLSPDMLSLAVMTNYRNGDTNPETNGLKRLMSMAVSQGDGVYWHSAYSDYKDFFASTDATTALAIRAIVTAGGDRELAIKGARYLTRNRKSNYWSNTFATAQVVRAITELSKTGDELDPSYNYSVTLDNKLIANGAVTSSKQMLPEIVIPVANIKPEGSAVSISKTGDGQIYSTLLIDEFRTDRTAKAEEHGLKISREYVNDKGEQYSLAVGDMVTVKLTVSGLAAEERYAVIADELPSGLIPVNQSLKNEQYGNDPNDYYYNSFNVTDSEVTENGMILSLYQIAAGEHVYTYKARVISEGKFIVPPATTSLMYAPEIYGRSDVQTLEITKESKVIPGKAANKAPQKVANDRITVVILIVLVLIGFGAYFINRSGMTWNDIKERIKMITKRDSSEPPITETKNDA